MLTLCPLGQMIWYNLTKLSMCLPFNGAIPVWQLNMDLHLQEHKNKPARGYLLQHCLKL
jgi:hypothetical protein